MSGPVSKTTFAHGEPVIVQGAFNQLLSPGLKQAFMKAYAEQKTGVNDILLGHPDDHCLHVIDIGDGMLVPCDLLRDLFGKP